jgi:hypothetical protein
MNPKNPHPLLAPLAVCSVLLLVPGHTAAGPADHDLTPRHGGVVVVAKDLDFELVAKATLISLHVRDHGKAVDLSKASAKLTLLTGTLKSEVMLSPVGDRLQALGSFSVAVGTKAVAVVNLPGKPPKTARFTVK